MSTSEGQKPEMNSGDHCVFVCQNQSCLRHNSIEVLKTFEVETKNLVGVNVEASGCLGQALALQYELPRMKFGITESNLIISHYIVVQHLLGNKPVDNMLNPRIHPHFY